MTETIKRVLFWDPPGGKTKNEMFPFWQPAFQLSGLNLQAGDKSKTQTKIAKELKATPTEPVTNQELI